MRNEEQSGLLATYLIARRAFCFTVTDLFCSLAIKYEAALSVVEGFAIRFSQSS